MLIRISCIDHYVKNHLNAIHPDGEINPKIRRSFKFTIRELRKQLENSQMHARFTRNQTQQMVDLSSQDRISVEEKTPHENMRKEKDNSYVSCDGTMIVRIPDIRKKLSKATINHRCIVFFFFSSS